MMRLGSLALAGFFMLSAPTDSGSADYAIYSAILGKVVDSGSADPLIVVIDSTEAKGLVTAGLKTELMRRHFGMYSGIYESTLDDFIEKNQKSIGVSAKPFDSWVKVKVVGKKDLPSSDTIDPKNPREFWNQFRAKYPGARGLISFSRPGFDEKKKHALVYYRLSCGTLCGQVGYVLLQYSGGRWSIMQQVVPILS